MKPILFAVIGLIVFLTLIQFHEQMHVEIFKLYGIESRISWTEEFPSVVTIPEENCYENECILAHNINDIIGWPLHLLFFLWVFVKFDYYLEHD